MPPLQATPATPVVDFTSYTDHDSLEQEDLVVWLTLGGWHIPLSEDAPNTPSTASHAGFVLRWACKHRSAELAEALVDDMSHALIHGFLPYWRYVP